MTTIYPSVSMLDEVTEDPWFRGLVRQLFANCSTDRAFGWLQQVEGASWGRDLSAIPAYLLADLLEEPVLRYIPVGNTTLRKCLQKGMTALRVRQLEVDDLRGIRLTANGLRLNSEDDHAAWALYTALDDAVTLLELRSKQAADAAAIRVGDTPAEATTAHMYGATVMHILNVMAHHELQHLQPRPAVGHAVDAFLENARRLACEDLSERMLRYIQGAPRAQLQLVATLPVDASDVR